MYKETDTLGFVLQNNNQAEEILTKFGMHCLYCPCSQMETIKEACEVHEIDVNKLLDALNSVK